MEPASGFIIRPATHEDITPINAILAHYALNTVMTFATTAEPDSALTTKFESITTKNHLPFLVATPSPAQSSPCNIEILGIAYMSPYRPERLAYAHTGELSLFVHHEFQGKGLGTALLKAVLDAAKETRIREVLAVMAVDEKGKGMGLALRDWYVREGFRQVGRLEGVGRKFGRLIDVIFLQVRIDGGLNES